MFSYIYGPDKEEAQRPDFYDNNCILWSKGFGLQAHLNTSPWKREEKVRAKISKCSQNICRSLNWSIMDIKSFRLRQIKTVAIVRWRTLCYKKREIMARVEDWPFYNG